MLERFLKSPIISVVVLIFLGILFVGKAEGWLDSAYVSVPFVLFVLVYYLLAIYNNKKFPDKKVKFNTHLPYELREEDEGMRWVTFKACRKVYIFYYYAIPTGILLFALLHDTIPYFTIWLLVLFGIIQYLIYWFEIRKVLLEGRD